jgi:hypothetical protein
VTQGARACAAAILVVALLGGCGTSKPDGRKALAPVERRLKVVGIPFKATPVKGKATAGIISRGVGVWAYPNAADAVAEEGGVAPALKRSPRNVLVEVHANRAYFLVVARPVTPVDKAQFDEIVGVGEG